MARLAAKPAALVVVGLAFFADTLVYAMLPPILPEYARIHQLSQTRLGLLFGVYAAALLLAALPIGHYADRRGRRGPFLGGLLGFGAATILFAFANSFPLLLLARVLQGIAAAATWVTGLAMLAGHFPAHQRGKALSTAFACANLGLFLGPSFSGYMVRYWSIRAAFLGAAALVGVDALVRLLLLPGDPPSEPSPAGYVGLLKDGTVRVFAGIMVLGSALGAVLEAVLPLHLARDLGMGAPAIGLAFTTAAVASTLVSPLVGHWTDRRGAARPVRLGLALAAVLLAATPFIPGGAPLFGFMFAIGISCSLLMSPCGPAAAGHVEAKGGSSFGSVFSLLNVAFSLGMLVGPVVGSVLTDLIGLKPAMGLLAACFIMYLAPVTRTARS